MSDTFRPRRISILLLISHMTICTQLIVRAATGDAQQTSKTIYSVIYTLFATGQRMIIVGNFSFVLEIHHEKTKLARGIFIGAILCVITSGALMVPANMYSFIPDKLDTSFLFRQLSAAVLLAVTLLFFVVLFWSKTIEDMTRQGVTLIIISSVLCLIVAIFNLCQAISIYYYNETNSQEGWFYGLEMTPIILAHFTWSTFHPKRSLAECHTSTVINRE